MESDAFPVSLAVKDLDASRGFYEHLGHQPPCRWAVEQATGRGKNGAVAREHITHRLIRCEWAVDIPGFQRDHVNPYLNYPLPCCFASIEVNERGRFGRRCRTDKAAAVMRRAKMNLLERVGSCRAGGPRPRDTPPRLGGKQWIGSRRGGCRRDDGKPDGDGPLRGIPTVLGNRQLATAYRFIEAMQPAPAKRSEPLLTRGGGPAAG